MMPPDPTPEDAHAKQTPPRDTQPWRRIAVIVSHVIGWPLTVFAWLIGVIGLFYLTGGTFVILILPIALAAALIWKYRRLAGFAAAGAALVLTVIVWRGSLTPSHDRDFREHIAVLPRVTTAGDRVTIKGVRDFKYDEAGTATVRWVTRTYDLQHLRGVDLIVEPFPKSDLMAHTMLSFDFGPDGWLVLTIEARPEKGESYAAIPGALNQFELCYQFATEPDAIGVRAVVRGSEVYAFPAQADPEDLRQFFHNICDTANAIQTDPRFYRLITDNCTSAWIRHVDHLHPNAIGFNLNTIFNGRLPAYLHHKGYLATDPAAEFATIQDSYRIDDDARNHADEPYFSSAIRADRPTP